MGMKRHKWQDFLFKTLFISPCTRNNIQERAKEGGKKKPLLFKGLIATTSAVLWDCNTNTSLRFFFAKRS